ncbi:hypothetical protein [Cytobacillus purgationiresistens]|uniref:Uncharacterized protein n=1 Tax=Cytobacillus purgationiresistens TaxID=863449 RepID=A0ABU0AKA7_9BACI|nr:hypothetical protein [Cytobacillus purgationiresistens]MDQ0271693.1 hypothetical protein [Cytobacillus purgationiresistens]
MDAGLNEILGLMKSNDLDDRREAIKQCIDWTGEIDVEDCLTLFAEAAKVTPLSREEWDDPSKALVMAAGTFLLDEMIPVIEKHIFQYSYEAIHISMSYLLIKNTEDSLAAYKRLFKQLYSQIQIIPVYRESKIFENKDSMLTALEALIENEVVFHEWYIEYYHYLLAYCVAYEYIKVSDQNVDKDFVSGQLAVLIEDYKEYDEVFTREYDLEAWKNTYSKMRFFLRGYLIIKNSYCTDEEILSYDFILKWKDPYIKLTYLIMLWIRKLDADPQIAIDILKGNYGTGYAYGVLQEYKKEALPTDLSIQDYFVIEAADFTFFNHEEGVGKFPDETEVMGSFKRKDYRFGDNYTYYIVRFRSSYPAFAGKGWMRMMIGPYHTGSLPTPHTISDQDANYTDFMPWESQSLDKHKEDFNNVLKESFDTPQHEERIFGSYVPSFNRKHHTIAILLFVLSILSIVLIDNDWIALSLFIAPIWLLLTYVHAKVLERNVFVQLREHSLEYCHFGDHTHVQLPHIESVHFEKIRPLVKDRFCLLPINQWHFVFYDNEGDIIYQIPRNYIKEEYFFGHFKDLISYYHHPPVIRWEANEDE